MSTRVQRKLEFPVRKSTRSQAKKDVTPCPSQSLCSPQRPRQKLSVKPKLESPRKRIGSDDDEENIQPTGISPSKMRKENRPTPRKDETPTLGKSKAKLVYGNNRNSDGPSSPLRDSMPLGLSSPVKVAPLTPRKDNVQNILNSPLKGKSSSTPSKGRKLQLSSPLKVKPLTPKKVEENSHRKSTPSLKLKKQDGQLYHKAKQSFHTAKPERLVGRDTETEEISAFVKGHMSKKTAGSIYISGAPGTGKTAVLTHILDNVQASHSCKPVYLNCMTLKDSATVYGKLYTDLTGKSPPSAKDRLRAVERHLTSTGPSIIMVLDEIDQLDSKNQEILYTIFEWPSMTKSRLILIGIANALDLTDRILPRLQARPKCKPKLLNFAPYSKDQIAAILKDRIAKLESEGVAVMENSAIQFCARKISAVAGDMRKALDVCRRAVEMVETEVRSQQVLKSNTTLNSPSKRPPAIPKKIGVMQISSVLSEVYGSSTTSSSQDSIPIQQKLVVCTLLLMVKQGRMKEVTMGKLQDTYTKVCKKRQMATHDEFQGLCSLLETRGIIGIKKPKEGRLAKVSLKLNEKELEHALQDKVLISSILQDGL
ncbi:cell division control protein 6 homolog [Mizuhopecten yessoensis]|uniref:Cell division control protein n=2 Tax=Mizuhopecten yessoensis TaxID=6573 RepID=A0A210QKE8_MIZYE|nr:cell division control protein 6 homolog [Mizuhopecten yessoensis]OWF49220.1 Cell division control protein 6-like [Mizuhopecten yessoensis]